MAKRVYAVMGATGQIGHVIVQKLLKKGHRVNAIGRNLQKLNALKSKGAEIYPVGGFDKDEPLIKAFQGADGVFGMIPPAPDSDDFPAYQDHVGEAILKAVQHNSIRYLVNLSSLAAHLPEGTGPIKGLYRQEQRLNTLTDLNVLHFRPGYFMENLLMTIPLLHQTGDLKLAANPNLPLPLVATEDIGTKIADFLEHLDFKGHTVFEFAGPHTHTLIETAKIIGKAIGKPDLKYVQLSYEEAKQRLLAFGMKPRMADLIIEMYTAFNTASKTLITQEITSDHKGTITLEHFAKETFAKVYKKYQERLATAH